MGGNIVGIDLGTSMSVIARLDEHGQAVTLPNRQGSPRTPSVIYYDDKRRIARVGEAARRAALQFPHQVAMFVKRDMGKNAYSASVDGCRFRPETLSAIILRKMKQDAERQIGPISKAVITVPAFFDEPRRTATIDAGRIAGLQVLDIINEPTAAALSYAAFQARQQGKTGQLLEIPGGQMTALVYDLGGGTFDVTVVDLRSQRFKVLATEGEVALGGKDWDERILNFMLNEFRQQFGFDPTAQFPRLAAQLREQAEQIKIMLSDFEQADVEFECGGHRLHRQLTRRQFEQMTADLLEASRLTTDQVLKEAGLTRQNIERVLLVGGSTLMPMVERMLTEFIGWPPDKTLDVHQVVAQGAAIYAGIVAARKDDDSLALPENLKAQLGKFEPIVHRNAHSLGVRAVAQDGARVNVKLIPKNSELPAAASQVFVTRFDGATSIRVRVLEGDADDADHCTQIGECCVNGLPTGLPRGSPVHVRLAYDSSGCIGVMALDMTHGHFAQAAIERPHRLTAEEIQREIEFVNSLDIQ